MDDKRLERIEYKIDSIMVEQAKQHTILQVHTKQHDSIDKELSPIKKHVARMQGAIQLITLMGVLAAIIETVILLVR